MHVKAVLLAAAYTLIVLGIAVMITGCETVKTIHDAYKDGVLR